MPKAKNKKQKTKNKKNKKQKKQNTKTHKTKNKKQKQPKPVAALGFRCQRIQSLIDPKLAREYMGGLEDLASLPNPPPIRKGTTKPYRPNKCFFEDAGRRSGDEDEEEDEDKEEENEENEKNETFKETLEEIEQEILRELVEKGVNITICDMCRSFLPPGIKGCIYCKKGMKSKDQRVVRLEE